MKQFIIILLITIPLCSYRQKGFVMPVGTVQSTSAAFALIAHNFTAPTSGVTSVTSTALNATGANEIIVGVLSQTSTTVVVTDVLGNVFTQAVTVSNSAVGTIYYCRPAFPTFGTGYTVTASGGIANSIFVSAWSGAAVSPADQTNTGAGTATTGNTGTISNSQSGELNIAFVVNFVNTSAPTVAAPYTMLNSTTFVSGLTYAGGMAYYIQPTSGITSATFTLGTIVNPYGTMIFSNKHS